MICNLSRRQFRAREQSRRIVIRSAVPLTRPERERLEVAAYWKMRFDERTVKAQAVVKRWTAIAEARGKAASKLSHLRDAVALRAKLGSSSLVPIALAETEAALEDAESLILHEGVAHLIGEEEVFAPRAMLRQLQARADRQGAA